MNLVEAAPPGEGTHSPLRCVERDETLRYQQI